MKFNENKDNQYLDIKKDTKQGEINIKIKNDKDIKEEEVNKIKEIKDDKDEKDMELKEIKEDKHKNEEEIEELKEIKDDKDKIDREVDKLEEDKDKKEKEKEVEKKNISFCNKDNLTLFLIEFLFMESGVFSIYGLTKYAKLNSVMNLSCLTIVINLVAPKYVVAFLTGGFISNMYPDTFVNPGFLLLSGFFSFILYQLSKKLLLNIGGRPGSLAFFGNSISFLVVYLISLSGIYEFKYDILLIDYDYYKKLNVYIYIFGPIVCMTASISVDLIAYYYSDLIIRTHRLLAFSVVACMGSMFLQIISIEYRILPSGNIDTYGTMLINFINIGAISGVTSRVRFLPNQKYFYYFCNYAFISLVCSFIGIGFLGIFRVGGKHGIVALSGNFIIIHLSNCIFKKKNEINETNLNSKNKVFENSELKVIDIKEQDNNNKKVNFEKRIYGAYEIQIQSFDFCL